MASIRKCAGSPFWFATYRDGGGRQCTKSTKVRFAGAGDTPRERAADATRNLRLAKAIAAELELAERGHPTEIHLRRVMNDIFQKANARRMEYARTEEFLLNWVATVEKNRKSSTWDRYQRVVKGLIEHMGTRAQVPIGDVTVQDIQPFIDAQGKAGKSATTVRMEAKVLSVVFAHAQRQGLTQLNPAAAVVLPDQIGETRAPFTWDQVRDLIKNAAGEWRTVIMLGVFTGARLGDCAGMRWKNIDLPKKLISFRPQKTSRKAKDLVVPMHPDLESHLLTLPVPDGAGAAEMPLSPGLAGDTIGGKHGLSRQFQEQMKAAGIENELLREGGGAGRKFYKYGFHSLRHTFNTMLMNQGVAQELRMRLSGHASEEMNAKYSHAELGTLRAAVGKLPALGQ